MTRKESHTPRGGNYILAKRDSSPTIYDIARLAEVSANTVSRALNGRSGVGDITRSRILEIARKLDYHPHVGARSLRGGRRAGCIGLTLPAPMDVVPVSQGFFVWLFTELHRVFGSRGERVCFDLNPYHANPLADYARSVWEKLYSVCVLAGPLATNDTTVRRIHATGIPYMALGRLDNFPECSSATVDYEQGAYVSTKYLLDRGHQRVALLKAFPGFQPGVERRRGYLRALEEYGAVPDERLTQSVTFGARNIANVVHRLLVYPDVTALVDSSGTEDADGIREGARRAGRTPGKDFEVVCWTYAENAAVMSEASAHMWLPVREAAAEGLEQLAEWHFEKSNGPIQILYPPVLAEEVMGGEVPKPGRLFGSLE